MELNAEKIKRGLEEFTKSFECYHQGYVEACGLICKVRREMVYDLANNRHPECNENCKDYEPVPHLRAMRNALALINSYEQKIFELENRRKECENGYEGTLYLDRCKLHDAEKKIDELIDKIARLTRDNERLSYLEEKVICGYKEGHSKAVIAMRESIKSLFAPEDDVRGKIDKIAKDILEREK